jgi:hypothetical protein
MTVHDSSVRWLKTLFLQAPAFDGFDGGAGSRYQAKREVNYRSFYFRPSKIWEIVREMLASWDMTKRRLREGVEFFRFPRAHEA